MCLLPEGSTAPKEAGQPAATDNRPTNSLAGVALADAKAIYPDRDLRQPPISGAAASRTVVDHRLQVAISQMSQAFAAFGPDQRLITCNQAYCSLYNLPPELSRPGTPQQDLLEFSAARNFVPSANMDELRLRMGRLLAGGTAWHGALEMLDGRIIDTVYEPLPDGSWISIQTDIGAERQREQMEMTRLRQAEAQTMRFNAAINNMNQGLSLFDADCKLVVCNDAFARLYCLPIDLTRPGTPFFDIFRHREQLGLVQKEADGVTAVDGVKSLIASGVPIKRPIEMRSGQVFMINHQPLEDGGWLSTHEDITEQHRNSEIIRYLARHDSLTGLANRTTFLEAMAEAEPRIELGDIMAVYCLDLDHFKQINDSLGHAVGDSVLTGMSARLRAVLDGHGMTARLGGDEFAALVGPLKTADDAINIARNLIAAMEAPLVVGNSTILCKASLGIALAPLHGHDPNVLMRCADLALYRAKSETPGGYCVFEARMDVAQRRRQSVERGLATAIANGELSLMFQPLVSLESGRIACCEALMRWQSPELGLVSPAEFISVAEESGLIGEIGVWALDIACMEATNWPCHVRVAVNVSPVQFCGDTLVREVRRALEISGLEPSRLELEITESLFLADDAHNLSVLHQLRELGVRFALDDFGTGYSSLAYLLRFPFDKVKIDRAIISTIAEKPETATMVTAIVDLCRGFRMLTVAEGIESEEQLTVVREHGCDEVQGYIFSPPVLQSSIRELLRRKQIVPGAAARPAPYVKAS